MALTPQEQQELKDLQTALGVTPEPQGLPPEEQQELKDLSMVQNVQEHGESQFSTGEKLEQTGRSALEGFSLGATEGALTKGRAESRAEAALLENPPDGLMEEMNRLQSGGGRLQSEGGQADVQTALSGLPSDHPAREKFENLVERFKQDEIAERQLFKEQHAGLDLGGQVVGGLVPGPGMASGAAGVNLARAAVKGAGLGAKSARGAVAGATAGAITGAGREVFVPEELRQGESITGSTLIGGLFGAAVDPAIGLAKWAASKVTPEQGVKRAVLHFLGRKLQLAHDDVADIINNPKVIFEPSNRQELVDGVLDIVDSARRQLARGDIGLEAAQARLNKVELLIDNVTETASANKTAAAKELRRGKAKLLKEFRHQKSDLSNQGIPEGTLPKIQNGLDDLRDESIQKSNDALDVITSEMEINGITVPTDQELPNIIDPISSEFIPNPRVPLVDLNSLIEQLKRSKGLIINTGGRKEIKGFTRLTKSDLTEITGLQKNLKKLISGKTHVSPMALKRVVQDFGDVISTAKKGGKDLGDRGFTKRGVQILEEIRANLDDNLKEAIPEYKSAVGEAGRTIKTLERLSRAFGTDSKAKATILKTVGQHKDEAVSANEILRELEDATNISISTELAEFQEARRLVKDQRSLDRLKGNISKDLKIDELDQQAESAVNTQLKLKQQSGRVTRTLQDRLANQKKAQADAMRFKKQAETFNEAKIEHRISMMADGNSKTQRDSMNQLISESAQMLDDDVVMTALDEDAIAKLIGEGFTPEQAMEKIRTSQRSALKEALEQHRLFSQFYKESKTSKEMMITLYGSGGAALTTGNPKALMIFMAAAAKEFGRGPTRWMFKSLVNMKGIPTVKKLKALPIGDKEKKWLVDGFNQAMVPAGRPFQPDEETQITPEATQSVMELIRSSDLSNEDRAEMMTDLQKRGSVKGLSKLIFNDPDPDPDDPSFIQNIRPKQKSLRELLEPIKVK